MATHAEHTYPNECCGLLVGHYVASTGEKTLLRVCPLENAWQPSVVQDWGKDAQTLWGDDPTRMTTTRRYWIDPQDFLTLQRAAQQEGLSIIGVYHSHPEATAMPSSCDRTLAWPDYSYIILAVQKTQNQIRVTDTLSWQLDDTGYFQSEPMQIDRTTPQYPSTLFADTFCLSDPYKSVPTDQPQAC
jgi:proteasome lid subunit RPN8/RPN11